MSLEVHVDFAPVNELMSSLDAYLFGAKTLELGAAWTASVEKRLGAERGQELRTLVTDAMEICAVQVLVQWCPGERTPTVFLPWLSGMSSGELYERLAPELGDKMLTLLRDLGDFRDRLVRALSLWQEHYFAHLEPAVVSGLAAEARERAATVQHQAPLDAVAAATGYLNIDGLQRISSVWLVPQYHHRPLVRYGMLARTLLCLYPVEALSRPVGEPPADLLRVARALGDENRMRVLRFLADEPKSFTDVLRFTGLAKNTVSHHLAVLRAAGLLTVHLSDEHGNERYTTRRGRLAGLGQSLLAFVAE